MGIHDPAEIGAPLLPGQDVWRLHCQSCGREVPQASGKSVGTSCVSRAQ